MSLRDQSATPGRPLSAWALRTASVLRRAGDQGASYELLRGELGASPSGPLEELARHGFVVGEDDNTFTLVHDPSPDEPLGAAPVVEGGEGRLFVRPVPTGEHWRET